MGLAGVGVLTGLLGAVVALPTLRLRGLYLALSTLAFAELAYFLFFSQSSVMGSTDRSVPPSSAPTVPARPPPLKVIDGRHPASGGCVHIAGTHVNRAAADSLARAGMCSVPEGRDIFPNLTVAENLWLMTQSRRSLIYDDVQERAYARFPILGDRRRQLAGTLSDGQQQMLALARAVVTDPALLLVDELVPDIYAVYSWMSGLLLAQALNTAGSVTRAAPTAGLVQLTSFTADGLGPPAYPAGKTPPSCWLLIDVQNGHFVRGPATPRGFRCSPSGYYRYG